MVLEQFIIDADIIWDQVGKTFFENPEAKPGRIMRVQVVNAGIIEDLTGYTLNLGWTSVRDPSKFGLDAFDDVDITKGIFEIEYTSGMLTNVGPLNASLQLVPPGEGRPIESNNFKLTVKNSAINPEAIQGETSFSTLENALVEVNGWNARIDVVEQEFKDRADALDEAYPVRLNAAEQSVSQMETQIDGFNRGLGETMPTMASLLEAYPTGDTRDHIVAGNVAEVDTLTVTGIPTVASNVTITLNGVAKTVAVDPTVQTTTALVAAAIRAAVYPGWATGGTGAIVIFTASSAGVRSVPTFGAGTTGVTAAFAVTAKGEDANYHRYFWNSTAWADGGAYQAIEMPEKSLNDIGDSLTALAKLLGVSIVRIADKKNFVGSGAYINATDGLIKTASSQPVDAYTGFIPVTAGNYYYYRGRVQGGGRLSMAFYSSNTEGSYISGIAGATEYYYDKLAKAPTGATYARFGYMIDPAYPFSVVDLGSKLISDLIAVDGTNAAAIAANATETGIVKKSVADELVYSSNAYAILGQFLKADGVFETHTSGFTTDYIPVKSDTIYLLKSRTSDARSFVLYDASYNFIAGYPGSSYGYTWQSQGEGAFLFHSGAAKFIRVSSDSATALVTLVRSVFATEAYTKSKAAIDANLLKLNQSFGYEIYIY